MNKKVLLIGRNPDVLSKLAIALTDEGFLVQTTNLVEQASQDFNAADFSLIAFGRGVDELTNTKLRTDFAQQNANILFVDGLAPVIPLLVKQIEFALTADTSSEKRLIQFSYQFHTIALTVQSACELTIDLYELDSIHTTQQKTLISKTIEAGSHTFTVHLPAVSNGLIRFLVAEVNNQELAVIAL